METQLGVARRYRVKLAKRSASRADRLNLAKVFLPLLLLLVSAICSADRAVVVGVEEYSPLVSASTLRGCLNDANAMKAALEKLGFKVTLLTNDKATKQGILDTIVALGKQVKRDERFVFYFAGHGRRTPHPALMPHDATADGNDLTTDELNAALLKVPAKSRTVILDACFSGGMAAGEMARGGLDDDPFHITARFWEPPAAQERSLNFGPAKTPVNNQDSNTKLENGTGICYYTACTASEQALEGSFGGERHGLFTNSLLDNLKDGKQPWSEVHGEVKAEMQQKLEKAGRQQNPTISKDFINSVAFTNDVKKPIPPKPTKSLLDLWNIDNADPSKVSIEFIPNQNVYEAGRKIQMTISVGQPGYLVVMGQVDGHFYQFWPQGQFTASSAEVKPSKMSFPPAGQNLFFDGFGADKVKAILLPTPEKAQQLLDALREVNGGTASQVGSKDLVMTRALDEPEYTSSVTVSVSDSLIGGLRFKSLEGLVKKVGLRNDPLSSWLWDRMTAYANDGYPGAKRWVESVDVNAPITVQSKQQFLTLLNLAAQDQLLYDQDAFREVKLPKSILDQIKKNPQGNDRLKLNRAILAAAYPEEVNPDDAEKKGAGK